MDEMHLISKPARRRKPPPQSVPRSICHQFPLRPNYIAQVVVPTDLTREEADRLRAFLMSMAVPEVSDRTEAGRSAASCLTFPETMAIVKPSTGSSLK
jgi:hypothetical protein